MRESKKFFALFLVFMCFYVFGQVMKILCV